jgi:AbrB family looped-hinge helix DNA binding protein
MTIEDISTVNQKGSVVIPSIYRKKYSINPGDKMVWVENKEGELVLKRFKDIKYEEL